MGRDDVPPDEMHLFRAAPDPIDAALRGDADDPAVEALVSDLRSAYLTDEPRPRSAALAAFAGTGDGATRPATVARPAAIEVGGAPAPSRSRIAVGLAAFAASLAGKVVLGGAVAAAALGGLHAAEVVDVPLLPHAPRSPVAPTTVPDVADAVELPAVGEGPARPGADAPTVADTPAADTPAADTPAGDAPPTDRPPVDTPAGDQQSPGADAAGDRGDAPTSVPPTVGPPDDDPADRPTERPAGDDAPEDTPAGSLGRDDEDPGPADANEEAVHRREDFATNP